MSEKRLRIDDVGLLTAAQRLYKQYGANVLEVIECHKLPSKKDAVKKTLHKQIVKQTMLFALTK